MTSTPFISARYTNEIIPLSLAREWLRVDIPGYQGEDNVIEAAIASAIDLVEVTCNLSLGLSTYTWNTNYLPCQFEDTFYIKELAEIAYKDASGYTVIDQSNYELLQISKRRSAIIWNDSFDIDSSVVRIKFTAGFDEGATPPGLLKAIRAMLSEEFDDRGDMVSEKEKLSDKLMKKYQIGYAG